jgi:thiamine kinase-like enzyme
VSGLRKLIDWEWSGPGDVTSELATMITLCGLDDVHAETVLELYFGVGNVTPLHRVRERLWRLYRLTREAGWCYVKSLCPGWEVAGYDYKAEAITTARRFASETAAPEVAEWLTVLSAALDGVNRGVATET